MSNCYIYRHVRLDRNEVFYVGLGTKEKHFNGPGREYHRAFSKRKRSSFWNNIVSKTLYEVEIILDDLSLAEAKVKEIEFIKLYGRRNRREGTLCNLTDGGEGTVNAIVSEATRRKLSMLSSGRKHRQESIDRMRFIAKTVNKNTTGQKVLHIPTGITYNSLSEACRVFGLARTTTESKIKSGRLKDFKINARPKRKNTTRSESELVTKR